VEYENRHLSKPRRSGTPAAFEAWSTHANWLAGFEAFSRQLPGAWWAKNSAGVYLYANELAEANLSAPHGGAVGKTDFDLLPLKIATALDADEQKVLSQGETIEALEQLRDDHGNTRAWFTARFPVQVERERGSAGFAIEISNFLVAKQDADGMLQQILDAITDMVLVKGPQSRLEWANKAFLSVYGMTNAQLEGLIDAPFSEPDLTQQYVKDDLQVFASGLPLEIPEESMIRHDGKVLTCHTVKSPIIDSTGKVIKTVAVIRDITERRRLELELRQAQKLESLGRLSSGIAHEINTPIQFVSDEAHFVRKAMKSVLPLCELYRAFVGKSERGEVTPEDIAAIRRAEVEAKLPFIIANVTPSLDAILDGTNRVAELVQSMKEFAHPDRGDREPADINRALRTTATICANETKYVADLEMDLQELPLVSCFVNELNQVFVNLLVNAAHAIGDVVAGTPDKGKITVTSRHVGNDVIVSISDTGTGIPEAARLKVFDPFFTTKSVGKGTGQGLPLARMIVVDKHQGSLTFETQIGSGTTFHIRIPVQAAPAA
jgi:two-component system NtrC family sensor kinase